MAGGIQPILSHSKPPSPVPISRLVSLETRLTMLATRQTSTTKSAKPGTTRDFMEVSRVLAMRHGSEKEEAVWTGPQNRKNTYRVDRT